MKRFFSICLLILCFASVMFAQSGKMTYQGRLLENGSPASGTRSIAITIYDALTGGSIVVAKQTFGATVVTNGLYNVTLTSLTASAFTGTLYVEVEVNGTTLTPRTPLNSVPSAFVAENATTATNLVGGANGSVPYQTASGTTAMLTAGSDGQVLTLASGVPSWSTPTATATDLSKAGDMTIVTTASNGSITIDPDGSGKVLFGSVFQTGDFTMEIPRSTADGNNWVIKGQDGWTTGDHNGGNIVLSPGLKNAGGADGTVVINTGLQFNVGSSLNGKVLTSDASGNASWTTPNAGTVTDVSGTLPISSTGGATPAISIADAAADGSTKGAATFTGSDFNASAGVISIDYANGAAASGSSKGFLTAADWTTFNGKQDALGFTAENVTNKVTSISGSSTDAEYPSAKLLYDQLALKQGSLGFTAENVANKVTSISGSSTDAEYPSAKLLYDQLALKQGSLGFTAENVANKVTSISGSSTDAEYPSAKLVYDQLALKEATANKVTSISGSSTDAEYPSAKLVYDQLALKQGSLGFTAENVANKVTSISGSSTDAEYPSAKLVYDQLALKQGSLGFTAENVANKVTSISGSSTDAEYPSAKLVYDQLALKQGSLGFTAENVANKVTSISGSSTDAEYPSAKLVYDQLALKQGSLGFTAENVANKVTSISGSSTDAEYPSAKLVYDQLALKQGSLGFTAENVANKVTSISGSSTDAEYPSAKLVYDQLALKVTAANMPDQTIKGNNSGSPAAASDLTAAQVRTILNVADGAEVNVQADWNQATGTADSYINNKPTFDNGITFTPGSPGSVALGGTLTTDATIITSSGVGNVIIAGTGDLDVRAEIKNNSGNVVFNDADGFSFTGAISQVTGLNQFGGGLDIGGTSGTGGLTVSNTSPAVVFEVNMSTGNVDAKGGVDITGAPLTVNNGSANVFQVNNATGAVTIGVTGTSSDYTLPVARGYSGQSLVSDAAGAVSWGTPVMPWFEATFGITATANTGYIVNSGSEIAIALPAAFQGSIVRVQGRGSANYRVDGSIATSNLDQPKFSNWVQRAAQRDWTAIATSDDGSRVIAISSDDGIFYSTDYGVTWSASDQATTGWTAVAMSADGLKAVACQTGAQPYYSADGGATWSFSGSSVGTTRAWTGVALSEDGATGYICSSEGIYQTANSGSTWAASGDAPARAWSAIATSADGSIVFACSNSEVMRSINSGTNWSSCTITGGNYSSIATSDDGVIAVVCSSTGNVYKSINTGADFTQITTAPSRSWSSISLSENGLDIAASETTGYVYYSFADGFSEDAGTTWIPTSPVLGSTLSSVKLLPASSRIYTVNNANGYVYIARSAGKKAAGSSIVGTQNSAIELLYDGVNWVPLSSQGTFIVY